MVTPQDVLIRAHDLLGEYGICRDAYAIDGNGRTTDVNNPHVVAFCSIGAISRALTDLGTGQIFGSHSAYYDVLDIMKAQIECDSVSEWNDYVATDQEILSTFRKAAGLPEPSVPVDVTVEAAEQVLVAV